MRRDAYRWEMFCRYVEARIELVRAEEGFDGRVQPWRTFDPPLPKRAPVDRPVRLRMGPNTRLRRAS